MKPKHYKPRHPLAWFKEGRQIIAGEASLFNQPITIQSPGHGKALHASQDRGIRYKSI